MVDTEDRVDTVTKSMINNKVAVAAEITVEMIPAASLATNTTIIKLTSPTKAR